MRIFMRSTLLAIVSSALLACTSVPQQVQFSEVPAAPPGDAFPNWLHPPLVELEQMQELDRAPFEIRSEEGAGAGMTGAQKVVAYVPVFGQELKLKLKRMPARLDGANNSPRKEMAAYQLQQLFLDPVDFVVPTAMPRCPSLEIWSGHYSSASPTIEGTSCVLVVVAFWLKDVELPDPLYDEERFLSDPRYAYHLANFNVLAYLIDHRDMRTGNALVSANDGDRRVYSIDNGISFGPFWFNWFRPPLYAWRSIRVPALPRTTVERLRGLRREDLDRLAVVAQLEPDGAGILRIAAPGAPIDSEEGVRVRGTTVQLGLTDDEIEELWERIQALIAKVDDGQLTVF